MSFMTPWRGPCGAAERLKLQQLAQALALPPFAFREIRLTYGIGQDLAAE